MQMHANAAFSRSEQLCDSRVSMGLAGSGGINGQAQLEAEDD
jgi:hypothetical protein